MGKRVHRLTRVDRETRTAVCQACGPVSLVSKGAGRFGCWKAWDANRSRRRSESERRRDAHLDGLMEAQGGTCAICPRTDDLCVDHDHATGVVRGLLCRSCNSGLGQFRDDPVLLAKAIDYLTRRRGTP